MKKGAIAKCIGDFESIDTSDYPLTETRLGETLRRTLNVDGAQTDFQGNAAIVGRGARQDARTVKRLDISESGELVQQNDDVEVTTEAGEFMVSAGEYIVAESTKKTFLHTLVAAATDTESKRYDVDIDGLIDAHPDATYWMGGIYDKDGDADTSDAYGDGDIFEDEDFGEVFRNSKKNRIGMMFEFETQTVKMLVTESGYVEVYRPSDFDTLQFKRLIDEVLMPHLVT